MASDGKIMVEMTADEARYLRAMTDAANALAKVEGGAAKIGKAAKEAAKEEEVLAREAKRVFEETRTPMEQFETRFTRLEQMLKKGAIDQQTFDRATVAAYRHMCDVMGDTATQAQKAAEETKRLAAKAKEATDRERELGLAAKKVFDDTRNPQEQYLARMAHINDLLKEGRIDQETYRRAASQAGDELDAAGKKGVEAFGSKALGMVTTLAGALGVGTGLAGAVALVRSEYEALTKAQERSREATLTVAEAEIGALRNLGANSPEERDQFLADVRQLSVETGVSERDLLVRASDALSARGALPVSQALESVKASAMLAPESPEEGKVIAAAGLDIGKFTGASPTEAVGYLMKIGEQARVTSTGKIAENLAPAMRAAMASGASLQTAGAMWAALTQGINDDTGRIASSAAINLSTQLEKFLPTEGVQYSESQYQTERATLAREQESERNRFRRAAIHDPEYQKTLRSLDTERAALQKPRRGGETPEQAADRAAKVRELDDKRRLALEQAETRTLQSPEFSEMEATFSLQEKELNDRRQSATKIVASGFRTMEERIAYLRQNPEALTDFLNKASFEAKADAPVREILSGKGSTARDMDAFAASLPSDVGSGEATYRQYLANVRGSSRQQTAQLKRELQSGRDRAKTNPKGQVGARESIIRDELDQFYQDIGVSGAEANARGLWSGLAGSGDITSAGYWRSQKQFLEQQVQQLRRPPVSFGYAITHPFAPKNEFGQIERPATAEEKDFAEVGDKLIAKMDEMIKAVNSNTAETKPKPPPTLRDATAPRQRN